MKYLEIIGSHLNPVQYFIPWLVMACLALLRLAKSVILANCSPVPLHLLSKSLPLHSSLLRW